MLVGCGGGGGNPGSPSGGTGGTGGTNNIDSTVASFVYQMDKPALTNSGSDAVKITVVALDVNNNPVAGASVKGAVDTGIFRSVGKVTDAAGKFESTVEIGGDKTNRTITSSITVNGVVKTVSIPVVGSQITITSVPETPTPGQVVRLDIRVADVLGNGIGGVPITLAGDANFTGSLVSDISGKASATVTAPTASGSYVATASGSGTSASKTIQVSSAAGGAVKPDAVGTIIAASLTANPTSIAPNIDGGSANYSRLSAKFLGTGNAGIENVRVRFEIVGSPLGAGERISRGQELAYSNSSGLADADYIAGTRTSPTNGVEIRACYAATTAELEKRDGTGAVIERYCPNSVRATLTVNSQPLSISIGNHNKMTKGLGGIAYLEQFLIQVADASGVAVKDAVVSASVDITHFGKGAWGRTYPNDDQIPDISLRYGNQSYLWVTSINTATNVKTFEVRSPYSNSVVPDGLNNVWCVNEDTNRNGTLEAGEDINHTTALEPAKSEIVLSYVNGNKTDANGQLLIQLSYPQNVGGWLAYTIKATTSVVGSEGTKERSFVTGVLQEDVENGAFLRPPYGAGSCIDPK